MEKIKSFNKLVIYFVDLCNSLTTFYKKQLLIRYFIDEIYLNNVIESISSTRYDIFFTMNKIDSSNNKIKSIIKSYRLLLGNKVKVDSLIDIRKIYNDLIVDILNKND